MPNLPFGEWVQMVPVSLTPHTQNLGPFIVCLQKLGKFLHEPLVVAVYRKNSFYVPQPVTTCEHYFLIEL